MKMKSKEVGGAKDPPVIGQCALCLEGNQKLENSHFLPAGVYRRMIDRKHGNPNPFRFNDSGWFQDNNQIRDFLLCRACEDRLNNGGERWFLNYCWSQDQFRLASLMDEAAPATAETRIKSYHATQIGGIDRSASHISR